MMQVPWSIGRHTLALINIAGSTLDVVGALYLAYDLLGGEHGPLRTLTRAVTYGALYGAGYGIALGPFFGLTAGISHGLTLAWEFSRASRRLPEPGFWRSAAMSAIRGVGFGVGAAYSFGATFGVVIGSLSAAGQALAYRAGITPTAHYRADGRPRVTRFQLLAALNRTAGYTAAGYLGSLAAGHRGVAWALGLRTGLAIGLVTAIAGAFTPFVEWQADNMPEKRMGVFGVALILAGFTLQSLQYWAVVFDVAVR
ncbi:MAG TPA: hypothetical protein VMU19_07175 [Bryobacteraceae bacterium]|nr:hypothetical protein [Bryobacteraceae bacterium]